ncbi:MAG: hypothetical protein KGL74_05585, partial [Elusimicrobia bacterium]|nr:hypothetical protein [Elusimicrobiota bacterium]
HRPRHSRLDHHRRSRPRAGAARLLRHEFIAGRYARDHRIRRPYLDRWRTRRAVGIERDDSRKAVQGCELEVRLASVVEHLYRWTNWKIVASSEKYVKKDAQTIEFAVPVKKDGEAVVTYTVKYSW